MAFQHMSPGELVIFAVATFAGTTGVALSGFGMAIIFLFVYQIFQIFGAMGCCSIKYAVFIQTIGLMVSIGYVAYKAEIRSGARAILLVPMVIAQFGGTPAGQFLQAHLSEESVRLVAGVILCAFCAWEAWRGRQNVRKVLVKVSEQVSARLARLYARAGAATAAAPGNNDADGRGLLETVAVAVEPAPVPPTVPEGKPQRSRSKENGGPTKHVVINVESDEPKAKKSMGSCLFSYILGAGAPGGITGCLLGARRSGAASAVTCRDAFQSERPWKSVKAEDKPKEKVGRPLASFTSQERPVFFMVGSQRSGSNWLRTMIDQSKEVAGPHPPHILKCWMPLVKRYGDLQDEVNFKLLIDHVCEFVEKNPVPWKDCDGDLIEFDRREVRDRCKASVARSSTKKNSLVAIFAALMDIYTERNNRLTWICKSMTSAKFHKALQEHFGSRLRYVYLHRDPRDVALSFSKAPVGDSHIYVIMKTWRDLQEHCMAVRKAQPDILYTLTYEQLLADKDTVLRKLFGWMGAEFTEGVLDSHHSQAAKEAASQSKLWMNLTRGPSFANVQLGKWAKELTKDQVRMVESIVPDIMEEMEYPFSEIDLDGILCPPPIVYTDEEIQEFRRLNEEGNKNKAKTLEADDPEDYQRRLEQEGVLRKAPSMKLTEMAPEDRPRFFMVGSQRSGSNWLRTMIDQSQEIAGPHPPHILKEWMKLVKNYGDLQVEANFCLLIDHVCEFVEKNPVPWKDAQGELILFDRDNIRQRCSVSVARSTSKKNSLVAIFNAVMDIYMERNNRITWICKSMSSAKFHKQLEDHFGDRLRYVYLHRDPRDVSLSFSKAPVGDSHIYVIMKTWRDLQEACMSVRRARPELMYTLTYEQLLADKDATLRKLFMWMGADFTEGVLDSHHSSAAKEAAAQSKLWMNLTRGPSFANVQLGKWAKELTKDQVRMVESIVPDVMEEMEYPFAEIDPDGILCPKPIVWTEAEIKEFQRLNEEGNKKKAQTLAEEDPEDFKRRTEQEAVLKKAPKPPAVTPKWKEQLREGFAAFVAGGTGGFLGGLIGLTGVPLIFFFLFNPYPKQEVRANGTAVLLINSVVRLFIYFVTEPSWKLKPYRALPPNTAHVGWFLAEDWPLYIVIAIAAMAGAVLGQRFYNMVNQADFKACLALLLVMAGVSMIIQCFV